MADKMKPLATIEIEEVAEQIFPLGQNMDLKAELEMESEGKVLKAS